ncbi:hypothetical protein [Nocardia fluminea]|uniref:hypothetical protein n=1 Tax=Nocardia fluminea TaxID=134984 RepID=UPI003F4CD6DF
MLHFIEAGRIVGAEGDDEAQQRLRVLGLVAVFARASNAFGRCISLRLGPVDVGEHPMFHPAAPSGAALD